MARLPWFFAFDHLPEGSTGKYWAIGDGGLATVSSQDTLQTGSQIVEVSSIRRISAARLTSIAFSKTFSELTELVVGCLYRQNHTDALVTNAILYLRGSGAEDLLNVHRTGDVLSVRRGATILDDSVFTLSANTDYYIELSAKIDASAGDWALKVDGTEVSSGTSANTGSVAAASLSAYGGGGVFNDRISYWTRIYVRERPVGEDGFYGPISMRLLNLTSDVAVDWTPDSGATNYTQAQLPVVTTSYLDSDTLDDVDENALDDVPAGVNSIIAVCRVSVSEAPDGGAPQIKHGLKRDVTEEYGSERTVGVGGPRTQLTTFTEQPNDDPWSITAVNELVSLRKSA